MKGQFIAIGDELMNGNTADSNGNWLAKFLFSHGIELSKINIIHDDYQQIFTCLTQALNDAQFVILSGGLGPTLDDLTKKALSDYFQAPLGESAEAISLLKQIYQRLGRQWEPEQNNYHMIPQGFIPTNNPQGAAPGLIYNHQDKLIMSAPGVPREFEAMVEQIFLPKLREHFHISSPGQERLVIRTKGIPEELIFGDLCPGLWQQLEQFGKVSSLPQTLGVDIVVLLNHPKNRAEILKIIDSTPLKNKIWQIGNLPLHHLIIQRAIEKKLTISLAESCTGGLISSLLTDVPGSSKTFMGSIISYANTVKSEQLAVSPQLIAQHGAVSTQVAEQMAQGARQNLKTDLALAITGIAGPSGGSPEKPVGTVAIAVATQEQLTSQLYNFRGDRLKLKKRFAKAALFDLLERLD